ncbi:putative stearoyl-CoA desaturase [Lobosporangium transversale]|uniref:Acyl-CoA desaturase n=1 Tax=Lobosporangium transversale TaxID=64571 RepID=A0A1Y2GX18_9FUNG|nr:putative stearoyl-CoA desaturase [Lobosporangium transversale]ORZ26321.1 putative stearoyl-CoA desaturase [Lobosporangium transversale]|eukprot:XP_021884086.1 putative stearoyl-CoA desaturase [Lobosporangium transversale]
MTEADYSVLYEPWSIYNFYKKAEWVHILTLVLMPIYGLSMALTSAPFQQKTAIFALGHAVFIGLGITAGYHRLWSHRSYIASPLLQTILMIAGTGAMQGSILWWCRNHRAHHRYTDTDKDPYGAHKGLLWSHFLWMLVRQDPAAVGWADISDLRADKLVMFQDKYFYWLAPMVSLGVPTVIAGLGWGDYWGGFIYGGVIRQFVVHQSTYCVNSLAHWLGDKPFDDRRTPCDHLFTALLTLGEGYHNFHHEFPQDYRNAIKFYQFDPTKWLIAFCSFIGLAWDLKRFPSNEIKKGQLRMQQKKLDKMKSTLVWGTPIDQLPVFSFDEFCDMTNKEGRAVTLIEGVIYDISSFVDEHPGGRSLICSAIGKDATTSFNGGVYDHSNAARHLMERMRIGVVAGGGYVEHRCKDVAVSHSIY